MHQFLTQMNFLIQFGQKEKSLATMFPDIAAEWDYERMAT